MKKMMEFISKIDAVRAFLRSKLFPFLESILYIASTYEQFILIFLVLKESF